MIERNGGCLHLARQFFSENHGGEIWCVSGKNKDGKLYVQNYYIPPNASDDDYALNGLENGFLDCEYLTVAEVRAKGKKIDPFSIP